MTLAAELTWTKQLYCSIFACGKYKTNTKLCFSEIKNKYKTLPMGKKQNKYKTLSMENIFSDKKSATENMDARPTPIMIM